MDNFGDETADASASARAGASETIGRDSAGGDRTKAESLYGPGVPTAESFADDVPPEWLHEEDGSSEELPGVRRH